jgi:hypothetical protein
MEPFDAIRDEQFRSDVGRGLLDTANRGVAGLLGGPVDLAALALKPLGYNNPAPIGGSEWIGGLMEKAGMVTPERRPVAEFLASLLTPAVGMGGAKLIGLLSEKSFPSFKGLLSKGSDAIDYVAPELRNASRSAKMKDPNPQPQRPFHDDYPQATGSPPGSRIAVDVDGRPLGAPSIAGRRVVGGPDHAIDSFGRYEVGRGLGINAERTTGSAIGGDVGRYIRGADAQGNATRNILLDAKLSPDSVAKVYSHELGHAIDDLTMGVVGAGGSKIPTTGIKKELARIYSDLNSQFYVPKGKMGATPKADGYPASEADAELMAEAIRAYMVDPNYIKTVAPATAARIREYVNSNPNLNKVIQFNGIGGMAAGAGFPPWSPQNSQER